LYISPDMIREVEVDEMGAAYSTNGSDQKWIQNVSLNTRREET
jgi:hypothetical protein